MKAYDNGIIICQTRVNSRTMYFKKSVLLITKTSINEAFKQAFIILFHLLAIPFGTTLLSNHSLDEYKKLLVQHSQCALTQFTYPPKRLGTDCLANKQSLV